MDSFSRDDPVYVSRQSLQIAHEQSWLMAPQTHPAPTVEADDPERAGELMAELIAQSCISDDDGDDIVKLPNQPLPALACSLAPVPATATGSWNASVSGASAAVSAIDAASSLQQPPHPYNLESYQSQQLCAQQQLLSHLLAPQPRLAAPQSSPPLTGVSTARSFPQIPAGSSPLSSHPSSPDCFTPPRSASPPAQSSPMNIRRSSPAASSPGDASSLGGSPTSVLGQRGGGMEGWDLLYAAAQKIEQQQQQQPVHREEMAGPSCATNLEARFASRLNQAAGARSSFHHQQPQQHLRRQQQQHLQQSQCRRGGPRHRGGATAPAGSPQTLRNPHSQQQQQQQQGSPLRRCSTTQPADTTRKLCQTFSAPQRQLSSPPPSAAAAADAACRTPVSSSPASPAPVASACPLSPLLLGGTGVFHPMRSSPPLAAAAHTAPSAASHTHAHSQRHAADGSSSGSTNPSANASPSSARGGGGGKKANRPAPTVYLPARLVKVLGLDVDPESNVVLGRSAVAAAAAAGPQQQQQQQCPASAAAAAGYPSRQLHGNNNKAAAAVRPAPIIKLAPDNIAEVTGKRGGGGGNGGRGWRCAAPGGAAGAPTGGSGRRASGRPAGAAATVAPAPPAAPSVPAAWAGVAAQPAPGQGSTEWSAAANLPVEWVY